MKLRTWVLALFITWLSLYGIIQTQNYRKCESILANVELACRTLQGQSDILYQENINLSAQLDTMTTEISTLRQQIDHKQDKTDRGGERGRIMEVTAYWEGSCGKAPDHPLYGITASGEYVQEGFIAAGSEYEIGVKLYIPYFNRTFTVMDRGGAIGNGCIDVYMTTAKECFKFGRQWLEVYGVSEITEVMGE